MLIQSLIKLFNSFSFKLLSIVFPFSNNFFIKLGNFSESLIIFSLENKILINNKLNNNNLFNL